MNEPLKILHVTPSFYPAVVYGGPIYSLYSLCQSLVRQGCRIRVLTTDANGPDSVLDVDTGKDVEVSPGVFVRYCHRVKDVSVSPTFLRLLVPQVRWADVIHLMAVYSFPTIPTLLTCKMIGKPVVWSTRGMLQRWEGNRRRTLKTIWESICQIVSPNRLVLHATSQEEATENERRLPGVETVVVPNGVEISKNVANTRHNEWLRLLYLGRIDPKKGIENLLRAYQIVSEDLGTMSHLVIAGAGEQRYSETIRKLIEELGLAQKVKMVGHVVGDAKEMLFQTSDVVIVPSYTENFGLVIAEALAHAIPVIASRGTPWKCLEDVGCGLWVDNDPNSLAAAIKRIKSKPLREMGLKGREWIQREFAKDSIAEKMVRVYRTLSRAS